MTKKTLREAMRIALQNTARTDLFRDMCMPLCGNTSRKKENLKAKFFIELSRQLEEDNAVLKKNCFFCIRGQTDSKTTDKVIEMTDVGGMRGGRDSKELVIDKMVTCFSIHIRLDHSSANINAFLGEIGPEIVVNSLDQSVCQIDFEAIANDIFICKAPGR